MKDYQKSISCKVSQQIAYDVITKEMSNWWTPMSKQFLNIGDSAKTDFGRKSYWVFKAKTLSAPNIIELECCEANHIHDGLPEEIKEEWLGTTLHFDISQDNDETIITLTHKGLTPSLKCYEVCEAGWDHYFLGSLKQYLENQA